MIAGIAAFLGLKGREHIVKWGLSVLAVLALIGGFFAALDAYGDSRFEAGEQHSDSKWKEASDKLVQKSLDAGTKADRREAARIADHAAEVAEEKERIDEALAEGSSPLDVLFGTDGR